MDRDKSSAGSDPDDYAFRDNQGLAEAPAAAELAAKQNLSGNFWHANAGSQGHEAPDKNETDLAFSLDHGSRTYGPPINLGEFVRSKFIPEYVASRKPAGRAHLLAILRYVVSPDQAAGRSAAKPEKPKATLRELPGWPYLGFLPLREVNADLIRHLTSTALEFGYSIQTATHIRSVIRAIFSHAIATNHYSGDNPAAGITLPRMARREPHALTVAQLKELIPVMRYPEKHIALFATLTDLNLSEICGLQWKYVNLSAVPRSVDGEWIPGRTIAVRRRSYRGQLGLVADARQRLVAVPELLGSVLSEIRARKHFTGLEDFVFVSRRGTLIYAENIAARRLKPIGRTLEMPWLSWHVFHRTNTALGRQLPRELKDICRSTGV